MNKQSRLRESNIERSGSEITPESVASMPIEDIKKGLSELGLDPNKPLPERLRRLISGNKVLSENVDEDFEDQETVFGVSSGR